MSSDAKEKKGLDDIFDAKLWREQREQQKQRKQKKFIKNKGHQRKWLLHYRL